MWSPARWLSSCRLQQSLRASVGRAIGCVWVTRSQALCAREEGLCGHVTCGFNDARFNDEESDKGTLGITIEYDSLGD